MKYLGECMKNKTEEQKLEWKKEYEKTVKLFKEEFKRNPEEVETYEELQELNKIFLEKRKHTISIRKYFYQKKIICLNCQEENEFNIQKGEEIMEYFLFASERYKEEIKCKRCGCLLEDNYISYLEPHNFELLKYIDLRNLLTEMYG
jgi:predicted protein tyrosine phosphatase